MCSSSHQVVGMLGFRNYDCDGGYDDESDDRVVEMKYSCGRYRDTLVDEVKGGLVKNDTWGRLLP